MKRDVRLRLRLLLSVGTALLVLFGQWWFRSSHVAHNFHGWQHVFDFILFLIVSYVVWHQIFMECLTWLLVRNIHHTQEIIEPQSGLKVAFITTYVPGAETPELLHKILPAMKQADYPHDCWLLDEGNDPEARRVCAQYGVSYFTRHGVAAYNTDGGKFAAKTKGGNHNAWYDHIGHTYDVVAQIDTDFVPQRNFLTRTLGYFRDPTIAFVGTPQIYGNTDKSWVAKGAAQQQFHFYGPILSGLYGRQMPFMLGANHVVRVSALRHVGYYAGHLTEDLLTSMRLHAKWYRSIYVPEQLAVGEGPTTWAAYFNQQMRWAFGCMDILFRHTPKLVTAMRRRHGVYYYLMQQHYFSGLAMMLGVLLMMLYFWLGITPTAMTLVPMLVFYLPLIIWQFVIYKWLQQFYVNPQTEKGFNLNGKLISIAVWPIYFLALVGVVRNKRLSFKVTPKNEQVQQSVPIGMFKPHLFIGTLALGCLASIPFTHRQSAIMVFWAVLTLVFMYGVAFHPLAVRLVRFVRRVRQADSLAQTEQLADSAALLQ